MAQLRREEEKSIMCEGGKRLGDILERIAALVAPGVSAWDIDQEAERLIVEAGGRPAFKGYRQRKHDPKFPSTICASVNDEVVHGIAHKQKILREGDLFSIDIGMQWPLNSGIGHNGNGLFTDTALTVPVGNISPEAKQLMNATKKALDLGIQQVQVGGSIAAIGKAIQTYIDAQGYGIVRDLVGHGVGYAVHEEPRVPNYYDRDLEQIKILPGMVIAIEPMITLGKHHVVVAEDEWTIRTADTSWSAHFEHTVMATEQGPIIVTKRPSET